MEVKPLKTESDYKTTLQAIERLFDAVPNTPDGDTLEILSILVENYEKKHHNIPLPDPIDALEYYLESHNVPQCALVPYIGSRARVSEILNRKRHLTLEMIRLLEKGIGIPASILIQPYELVNEVKNIYEFLELSAEVANSIFLSSDSKKFIDYSPKSENRTIEYISTKQMITKFRRNIYRNTQLNADKYLQ